MTAMASSAFNRLDLCNPLGENQLYAAMASVSANAALQVKRLAL